MHSFPLEKFILLLFTVTNLGLLEPIAGSRSSAASPSASTTTAALSVPPIHRTQQAGVSVSPLVALENIEDPEILRRGGTETSSDRLVLTNGGHERCTIQWNTVSLQHPTRQPQTPQALKRGTKRLANIMSASEKPELSPAIQMELQIRSANCKGFCINKHLLNRIMIQHQQQAVWPVAATRIVVKDIDVFYRLPDLQVDDKATHSPTGWWCCHAAEAERACVYRLDLWNQNQQVHTTRSDEIESERIAAIPELTQQHQLQIKPNFGHGTLNHTMTSNEKGTGYFKRPLKNLHSRNSNRVRRIKRNPGMILTEPGPYLQTNHRLTQPKNLQIIPFQFGSFNISWEMESEAERWISHYELVLLNLGEVPSKEEQLRCGAFLQTHNLTDGSPITHGGSIHDRQLSLNITAPASSVIITGLPPDNFYRVLLFAMIGSHRSTPASMPSSPRVPALPPLTSPSEVKVTSRGTQAAKVAWRPPIGADCTGELINYVITINSTRLIEPLIIKLARDAQSHVVTDLIPGTYYSVQVAATTRGGVGVASVPVHFRTGGELPQVEFDDLDEVDVPLLPEELEEMANENRQFFEGGLARSHWISTSQDTLGPEQVYLIPAKIYNLRATPDQTTVHLKWSVALRRVEPDSEHELFSIMDKRPQMMTSDQDRPLRVQLSGPQSVTAYLPPGTKYIVRWGDMHPGPSEDTVMGDQTEYLMENLRPGTIYYVRVIAVTRLGDGPAAYTVTMTRSLTSDTGNPSSNGPIIPVNLVVRAVGSTWARVGWELPELPTRLQSQVLLFKIKYYPINVDRSTIHPFQTGSPSSEATVITVNLSVPLSPTTPASQQSWPFKAVLRGLQPATQYEFGVCLLDTPTNEASFHMPMKGQTMSPELCWSMVQGFETFGKNPSDAPTNIRISVPRDLADPLTQNEGAGREDKRSSAKPGVLVRLHWDAPLRTNGEIGAYVIYLSADRSKSVNDWSEHIVPGSLNFGNLPGLQPKQIYFLRMVARNRHGTSPFSPVVAFRTPDSNGQGGGMVRLSKTYYDAREIFEPLDTVIPAGVDQNQAAGVRSSNNAVDETSGADQLRWIIVGSVLGGTVVIVLVATAVLFTRCRNSRNSLGIMKRSTSKQPYMSGYPNVYRSDTTGPADLSTKTASFSLQDHCHGGCSVAGSGAGGSNSGCHLVGCTLSDNPPMDPRPSSHECSGHHTPGIYRPCLDWSAPNRMHGSKCHMTGLEPKCSCAALSDSSGPIWTQPMAINPGCIDDRHSTTAGSDIDAPGSCSGSSRRFDPGIGRKQSKRNEGSECCDHGYHRQGGYVEHTSNCHNRMVWNQTVGEGLARDMTTSFLSSSKHRPGLEISSDPFNHDRGEHIQQNNAYRPIANNRRLMNGYRNDIEERSPDMCFGQPRSIPAPMVAFTGSGSLNDDEAITSSPASSSAGRASANLPHWSPMRKYHPLGQQSAQSGFYPHDKSEPISPQRSRVNHCQMRLDEKCRKNTDCNPSSASSAVGTGFSPERPFVSKTNMVTTCDQRAKDIGLSFALDRVPTPEPTPRPAPLSRLAAVKMGQHEETGNCWNIEKLEDLIGKTKLGPDTTASSPTLVEKAQLSILDSGPEKIMKNRDGFSHENTPETVDSISEKQLVREYSAEELHQEMVNLEGLMKDLSQITQHQFEC
ncbi:hypothetical protein CRM22_007226 [Opisthorchis felineus]|uniref:Fibronectin type-III domain-containing protein n=1 Tax=Opisthorchis felineus TaxID=147828 RepID=A0A4S2LH98_OPIFE|nr:hypothetical protein CRM22_007226 [Opisthorchis felineus]